MMRKAFAISAIAVFITIHLITCEPFEKVSEIPNITFKDFELYEIDTFSNIIKAGKLTFTFIDGNADIGVNPEYSPSNDSINFYLIPFEKLNGEYFQIPDDTLKYQIRSNEKLDRVGQNKTIKGEISLLIYYFITPPHDTIRYDFYIFDRAGNQSNIEETTDIGFN